jgi:hypothetical protein
MDEHDQAHRLGGSEVHADLGRRQVGGNDQHVGVLQGDVADGDSHQRQRHPEPALVIVSPARLVDLAAEAALDQQHLHQRRHPCGDHGRACSRAGFGR